MNDLSISLRDIIYVITYIIAEISPTNQIVFHFIPGGHHCKPHVQHTIPFDGVGRACLRIDFFIQKNILWPSANVQAVVRKQPSADHSCFSVLSPPSHRSKAPSSWYKTISSVKGAALYLVRTDLPHLSFLLKDGMLVTFLIDRCSGNLATITWPELLPPLLINRS